ncbi:MAG: putative membrane protein/domain [Rhodobacteraceae bacterium HLUCCA08]|nr:MAG: putative membrane protein/domain [Rhodobacteraceae bacterium HLUCCA08]
MLRTNAGLPDPDLHPEAYAGVLPRRLAAWVIDMAISAVLAAMALPFTLFLGIFVFPAMVMAVGLAYRAATIALLSATPGMVLMGLHLRDRHGARLSPADALWHSAGYTVSMLVQPLQLVSVAMMALGRRHQGLTDQLLGTAMVDRCMR